MPTERQELYLYVDETGQTQKSIFVIGIVMFDATDAQSVMDSLLATEVRSRKLARKWVRTPTPSKQDYLSEVTLLCQKTSVKFFYAIYENGLDYVEKLGTTIVDVIQACPLTPDSKFTIIVDALNAVERERVSRHLRRFTLPYRREVRGGREDNNPYLRLADAVAGFVRHAHLDESYTKPLWQQLLPYLTKLPT